MVPFALPRVEFLQQETLSGSAFPISLFRVVDNDAKCRACFLSASRPATTGVSIGGGCGSRNHTRCDSLLLVFKTSPFPLGLILHVKSNSRSELPFHCWRQHVSVHIWLCNCRDFRTLRSLIQRYLKPLRLIYSLTKRTLHLMMDSPTIRFCPRGFHLLPRRINESWRFQ